MQEIGEIRRKLKLMARELAVCVLALSQLSRAVESRQDKRHLLSDLRETGQIEQDADLIAFLYREEYYDAETANKNITEIILAKQRNGPVGTVELAFIKAFSKFINFERRYDNQQEVR
ncbi:replicative DNA helicase, partial [Bacillus pseudomycoides]|uniref:replicative DNA helicase n=1 Tax=Bacillus pseudomycoides TaxID=64104 RepID=UPI00283F77DF